MISTIKSFKSFSILFLLLFSLLLFSFSILANDQIRAATNMKEIIDNGIGEKGLGAIISALTAALVWLERRFSLYRKEQKKALEDEKEFYRKALEKKEKEVLDLNALIVRQSENHHKEMTDFIMLQNKKLLEGGNKQLTIFTSIVNEFSKILEQKKDIENGS